MQITKPDAQWLAKLLDIITYFRDEFPEEFSNSDDETILIAGELIERLNNENTNV